MINGSLRPGVVIMIDIQLLSVLNRNGQGLSGQV